MNTNYWNIPTLIKNPWAVKVLIPNFKNEYVKVSTVPEGMITSKLKELGITTSQLVQSQNKMYESMIQSQLGYVTVIQDLQQHMDATACENARLDSKVNQLEAEKLDLRAEILNLQTNQSNLEAEKLDLQTNQTNYQTHNWTLQTHNWTLQTHNWNLYSHNVNLQNHLQSLSYLQNHSSLLVSSNREYKKQIQHMQSKHLTDNVNLVKENADLRQAKARLANEVEKLQKKIHSLEAKNQEGEQGVADDDDDEDQVAMDNQEVLEVNFNILRQG